MADSATTPDVPVVIDGDVIVEFNEASSRQQINSGESVKTLFGKIRKFLTDLKAVAFSGNYSDLDGVPSALPANGGNADYATNAGNAKTLSSKSIDYFMHWREEEVINPDDVTNIGIYQWSFPTTITSDPIAYGTLIVSNAFGYKCQIAISVDTSIYVRHKTYDEEWSAWRNVSDGGNADTVDGYHASDFYSASNKPCVTGTLNEQASTEKVMMSFPIFDFTPSKVLCQFGSGNAFFANVVTNGFSVTIPAGTTTIHYIAFK